MLTLDSQLLLYFADELRLTTQPGMIDFIAASPDVTVRPGDDFLGVAAGRLAASNALADGCTSQSACRRDLWGDRGMRLVRT